MQVGKYKMSMIQDKNFPQPYEKCFLEVGDGHKIYVEKVGNPEVYHLFFYMGDQEVDVKIVIGHFLI